MTIGGTSNLFTCGIVAFKDFQYLADSLASLQHDLPGEGKTYVRVKSRGRERAWTKQCGRCHSRRVSESDSLVFLALPKAFGVSGPRVYLEGYRADLST